MNGSVAPNIKLGHQQETAEIHLKKRVSMRVFGTVNAQFPLTHPITTRVEIKAMLWKSGTEAGEENGNPPSHAIP